VDGSSPLALNDLVDISLASGASFPSRVEGVNGDVVRVAAPLERVDPLRTDDSLELAWLVENDRYAAPMRFVGVWVDNTRTWDLRLAGEPRRQNRRGFVRGGGGEAVRLRRPDDPAPPRDGHVIDVGEEGVRARVRTCDYDKGETLTVTMLLGDDVIEVEGPIFAVRRIVETGYVDIVVQFHAGEQVGRMIRGYILKQQLERRRRAAARS
jgi:hypothetical protein